MLSINFVRENSKEIEKNLKKRKAEEKKVLLKKILEKDKKYRELLRNAQELRHKRNEITHAIDNLRQQGKDKEFKKKINEAKEIPSKIKEIEEKTNSLKEEIDLALMGLPNILHESVPYGKSDEDNVEIKRHGKIPKFNFDLMHHGELASQLNIADFENAVKISGAGFYALKGDLALMDLALQRFAIDLLMKKGFTLVEPPFMMRKQPYSGTVDFSDFEDVMYKVEGEDLYLIATSEHPLVAMFRNEIIGEEKLPIKLCGLSACFRKEIGKHGLDERGLFRVHQFNKVEQVVICKPEDSWKIHEELLKNSEELTKKLGIPYRIVNVCTGDIGNFAAKKYDVEGYSPRENKYIELMSCSNVTNYQAVRSNIKFRKKDNSKKYAHTLNNTEVATARMLRLILENYQLKDGSLKIPKVLQPYMNGKKKISPVKQGNEKKK